MGKRQMLLLPDSSLTCTPVASPGAAICSECTRSTVAGSCATTLSRAAVGLTDQAVVVTPAIGIPGTPMLLSPVGNSEAPAACPGPRSAVVEGAEASAAAKAWTFGDF